MNEATYRKHLSRQGSAGLWFAFLGAPIAWFVDLFFLYFSVTYACVTGRVMTLYVLAALPLLVSLAAAVVGYGIWRDTGAGLPQDQATRMDRSRLLAVMGLMMTGLTVAILVGQLVAIAVLGPCIPLPRVRFTPDASGPAIRGPLTAKSPASYDVAY